tara:strand:+ start:339 stop:479 length:141 start_codon:yes stop_codon:yes gene_type:complete
MGGIGSHLPGILEHLQANDGARDCIFDQMWEPESSNWWPQFSFGTG